LGIIVNLAVISLGLLVLYFSNKVDFSRNSCYNQVSDAGSNRRVASGCFAPRYSNFETLCTV